MGVIEWWAKQLKALDALVVKQRWTKEDELRVRMDASMCTSPERCKAVEGPKGAEQNLETSRIFFKCFLAIVVINVSFNKVDVLPMRRTSVFITVHFEKVDR